MNRSFFSGFFLALFIFSATIDAALLFDNGAPDLLNGFEITHWKQANSFTLTSATFLRSVKFWDLEASSDFQGSILWEIRSNSPSNTPGAVLFSGTSTNLIHMATGRNASPYPEFVNTFDIPSVSLLAGTFWLVLHNGPLSYNVHQDIFWETTSNNRTDPSFSNEAPFTGAWETNNIEDMLSQLAFQLNGVIKPRITMIDFFNGDPRISFTTVVGQNYRVEYKNNLTDASWTAVSGATNVAGTGNVVPVSDPDPNVPNVVKHRFYRVVVL